MKLLGLSIVAAFVFFYVKGKSLNTSTALNTGAATNGFTNFFDSIFGLGKSTTAGTNFNSTSPFTQSPIQTSTQTGVTPSKILQEPEGGYRYDNSGKIIGVNPGIRRERFSLL